MNFDEAKRKILELREEEIGKDLRSLRIIGIVEDDERTGVGEARIRVDYESVDTKGNND